jgi:ABC-2 type transport system ATP-binding protein
MLELIHLTKIFNSLKAVDDVSLKVDAGDFYGFLGLNGAGKTTTIKMLAGLYSPTGGNISINGTDILKHPVEAKKMIGYVPDQPFLYDKLTGKEFLYFCGGLYNISPALLKVKIDGLVEQLKIGDWINKRTEQYSQGMKQRVSIASALLHEPKLILVDEPMIGLDPLSAQYVKTLLKQKADEGCAVFMSTHSLNVAEEVCSKIAIIKEGKIIFDGNKESIESFRMGQKQNLESFFLELNK